MLILNILVQVWYYRMGENIFEIAGEDNNFFPATVKIQGNEFV